MPGAITLANLVTRFTGDTSDLETSTGRGKSAISGFASSVGGAAQAVGKAFLGMGAIVVGAVGGIAVGLGKLAMESAGLVNVKDAFDGIAASAGTSGDAIMAAFDEASGGMVSMEDAMMSFNKAAMLVSDDFAVQLPEAMGYLGKVSAATGQDVNFMLDSLVTGVGRLSPMILDNLGIQVSLAEATERAAEMFGVEESALTKTQQQAGMMDVVLSKLAKNTAAMPDITKSAAGGMAALGVTFKNTKDKIGMSLVPALGTLAGTFSSLVDRVLPPLVDFFESVLAPAIEVVAGFISMLVGAIVDGVDPVDALRQSLLLSFGPEITSSVMGVVEAIQGVIEWVKEALATVQPYIDMAVEWILQNVELKDILIAVGIAIASVVVPAVISLMTTLLPIVAIIVAIIGAVALLRKVWEEDLGGIKTFFVDLWEETLKPAF